MVFLGGILCYLDFLVLISKFPLKHYFGVDTVDVYYVFLFWLLVIMIWWVFGFGRIFSGAINTEPFMGNFDLILFNIPGDKLCNLCHASP